MNDQDEMFEAATETPVGEVKSEVEVEELKKRGAKLKACNDRSYAKMNEIARIANECILNTTHGEYAPGQYGQDYRTFGRAMCEIRKLVGPGLAERFAALPPNDKPIDPSAPEMTRKPTMDFGRFHVTRAAIPGTTILTFRRKREHLPEFATVVPSRIIVAKIIRKDVGAEKPDHRFTVKSYEAGEKPRVLCAGDSWVSMSKTEKIVYKMVKTNIKETQRRHITRKRKRDAAKAAGEGK